MKIVHFIHFSVLIFTFLLSFFAIVATALPFIKIDYWLIRIFSYPRLQIAIIGIVAITLNAIFLKLKRPYTIVVLGLLLLAVTYQATLIIPYTPLYPVQAEASTVEESLNNFSIMEFNILMENRKVEKFMKLVDTHDPDVLLIIEPNKWWARQLTRLDKEFSYAIKYPLDNTYGMILFSKLPLKDTEINFIIEEDIPSFFATVILPSGDEFDLYCVHPKPPTISTSLYQMDTELLLIGRRIKKRNRPALVTGDLNDVTWSYTVTLFQRYSGLLDPRQGRGLFNTFNAHLPLLRYPLDHFFYTRHFGLLALDRLGNAGSDHFSMFIKLHFDPEMDYSNQNLQQDHEVEQEVEEVIER